MPRRNFKVKRRYRYKRRKDTVKKVRKTLNKLKRQVETKFVNTFSTSTVLQTPTGYNGFQPLASEQGVGVQEIIGDRYHAQGAKINGILSKGSGNVTTCVRFIVLWLKSGVSERADRYTFSTYYDDVDSFATSILPFVAPLRSEVTKSVRVLVDKKMSLGTFLSAGYAGGPQNKHFSMYLPLGKNVQLSTGGLIENGELVIFALDRYASNPTLDMNVKFYYKDS